MAPHDFGNLSTIVKKGYRNMDCIVLIAVKFRNVTN